jgi:hypothetical protein
MGVRLRLDTLGSDDGVSALDRCRVHIPIEVGQRDALDVMKSESVVVWLGTMPSRAMDASTQSGRFRSDLGTCMAA